MTVPIPDSVLRRTLAIAADAVICVDDEMRITFFNEGATAIFGWTADELLGRPIDILIPSRVHSAHREHMERFGRSSGSARLMGQRSDVAGVRKDGTEFPAEASIAHIEHDGGRSYSVVLRDITERKRFVDENAQLVRDLLGSVAARDDMLSIVSHDLRNPVNAVKMLAAAILRSDETAALPEPVAEHAAVMLQAALQMDALIQDLLDVSKLESGRMAVQPRVVSMAELVADSIDVLRPSAEQAGVVISTSFPDRLPDVDVDPARITQVLANLISNGIKYSPHGGEVRVSAVADEDVVRVSIEDNGVGIAAAELPRVFDRFWQSKRTNRSGAGLGLTIARGLVRAHGGRIWIESTVGTGTTVHFTVPRANHHERPTETGSAEAT